MKTLLRQLATGFLIIIAFISGYLYRQPEVITKVEKVIVENQNVENLTEMATNKSIDMVNTKVFEHTDSDGTTFFEKSQKIQGNNGENLAKGYCDIRDAIVAWENSPTHLEVLNMEYKNAVLVQIWDGERCYTTLEVSE